jgi:hypothetical protein
MVFNFRAVLRNIVKDAHIRVSLHQELLRVCHNGYVVPPCALRGLVDKVGEGMELAGLILLQK